MSVARTNLAEQVAEELVARIERTGLQPGDAIPSESALAEELDVNHLIIREAIRMLTARELLVSSQGRPARVSTPSARVLAQMLDFRVRQESLEIADVLSTRRLVECELARLAARRVAAGEGRVEEAADFLDRMEDAAQDRDRFVEFDVRFHAAIGEVAGAELLKLILSAFEPVLLRTRRSTFEARVKRGESHESTLAAHREILRAIARGDEGGAADAMGRHLEETGHDAA